MVSFERSCFLFAVCEDRYGFIYGLLARLWGYRLGGGHTGAISSSFWFSLRVCIDHGLLGVGGLRKEAQEVR